MIAYSTRLDKLSTKIQTISVGDTQKKGIRSAKNGNTPGGKLQFYPNLLSFILSPTSTQPWL
jgi:hypothetical protein